jgi:hypothetical protein
MVMDMKELAELPKPGLHLETWTWSGVEATVSSNIFSEVELSGIYSVMALD